MVADRYGSVWGGVTIGLVDASGAVKESALTDHQGRYSITTQPGRYRVWLHLGRTGPSYDVQDIDLHEGDNTFDIVTQ